MEENQILTLLEPQKIISEAEAEYLLLKREPKFRTKVGKNPLPYIQQIPYDNKYIIAKTAQELGISMGEVAACTTLFYKEVVENFKRPQFKTVEFTNIGNFNLTTKKLLKLIKTILLPLAKEHKDTSVHYKRFWKAWKLYRALNQKKVIIRITSNARQKYTNARSRIEKERQSFAERESLHG